MFFYVFIFFYNRLEFTFYILYTFYTTLPRPFL